MSGTAAVSHDAMSVQRRRVRLVGLAPHLVPVVALSTFIVLMGRVAFLRGGGPTRPDQLTFFYPWSYSLADRLRNGDIPAWNPHVFSGVPFAGDPESGWTYLPTMIPYLLFQSYQALIVYELVHYAIAGMGAYILARTLGIGLWGATLAAIMYAGSAPMEQQNCCTTRSMVATWIPVALIGLEMATRARSWPARLAWWGVAGLGISQFMAGWLGQGAYYAFILVGGYVGYRTLIDPPGGAPLPRRLRMLALHGAGVVGTGLGLSAAALLPRFVAVERSTLAGGEYEGVSAAAANPGGWPPVLLLDRILSHDGAARFYIGGAALTMAIVALVWAFPRSPTPFFAASTVGFIVLSGQETVFHRLFYILPRFQTLHEHVPSRATLGISIGVAMLAGAGLDAAIRSRIPWWRFSLGLAAPVIWWLWVERYLANYNRVLVDATLRYSYLALGLLAVLVVLGLVLRRQTTLHAFASAALAVAVILVTFQDPVGASVRAALAADRLDSVRQYALSSYVDAEDPDQVIAFLKMQQGAALASGSGPFRYAGFDMGFITPTVDEVGRSGSYHISFLDAKNQALLVNNRAMRLGLYDAQGYNPLQPARYVAYFQVLNGRSQEYHEVNVLPSGLSSPLLDMLNIRYLVVPFAIPPGRPDLLHVVQRWPTVHMGTDVRVLENPNAFPRAWVVHQARQVSDDDVFQIMAAGGVDYRREVLLEQDLPELPPSTVDPTTEPVSVTHFEGDRLTLQVNAQAPGYVVLSEVYDPDWTATINGDDTDVIAANGALRAVAIPAGESEIELTYRPISLTIGLAITGFTIVLVSTLPLLLWWRERRRVVALPARARAASTRSPV